MDAGDHFGGPLRRLSRMFARPAHAATPPIDRSKAQKDILESLLGMLLSAGLGLLCFRWLTHQLDPNRFAAKQAAERKKELRQRLGRNIKTNSYEDVIACDVINPDHIATGFDDIGGLDTVKQSLYELVILPLSRPDLFARGKLLKPVKGVLLYGPPGTGKTMLAKAIARESRACFINVRAATLQSKWFGDAQKLVTAVFTLALKLQPAIVFIDEIDSMLGKRHSQEHEAINNMKTEFMSLWDGFTTDEYAQVMVLGATNRPWEIDEAVLRRMPQSFLVGLPDAKQREAIVRVMLEGEPLDESFQRLRGAGKIAGATEGFSGSDLKELCKNAAYYPIRELLQSEMRNPSAVGAIVPRALRLEDFMAALQSSKPTGEQAMKYMKQMVMQSAAKQMGVYFNTEGEDDEDGAGEEGGAPFDPLGRNKNRRNGN